MRGLALSCLCLIACSFDGSTNSLFDDDAGGSASDARVGPDARGIPDAMPPGDAISNCMAGQALCINNSVQTCAADGSGIDENLTVDCAFACVEDGGPHCVVPSNLVAADLASCAAASVQFTPSAVAAVTIVDNAGTTEIHCAPDCGDGSTTVIPETTSVDSTIAMFCLSIVDIPAGLTITPAPNLSDMLVFLSQGAVTLAGTLDLSGGPGQVVSVSNVLIGNAGTAGPGGGKGGDFHDDEDEDGEGACPGLGGKKSDPSGTGNASGGGGGGGAFGGEGASGGLGQSSNDPVTIAAGGAPTLACGTAELIPLAAGSGGGSGGDGNGGWSGWPGGGGGGAIQISSGSSMTISGSILANGGDGFHTNTPTNQGGGGAGGSGGGILLEAPTLSISGTIAVDGGDGATSNAGIGGTGGTGNSVDGNDGTDAIASGTGGAGGGGGAGRVRLHATVAPTCSLSLSGACSASTMAAQPTIQ